MCNHSNNRVSLALSPLIYSSANFIDNSLNHGIWEKENSNYYHLLELILNLFIEAKEIGLRKKYQEIRKNGQC